MATYYLDNNVLVEIEQKALNISTFTSLQNSKIYFSPTHIEELIEGQGIDSLSVEKRLKLIEDLASNNCILPTFQNPKFYQKSPLQVYQDEKNPFAETMRQLINSSISNLFFDREKFLSIIKMKKTEINNIPSQNVLKTLDEILLNYLDINISEIILKSEAKGRAVFVTLFNLLDWAYYYKDKQTEHSNIARSHDASHAYYAQLCDYFVSQDKRMRFKTKAVYSYLDIKTAVWSIQELTKET